MVAVWLRSLSVTLLLTRVFIERGPPKARIPLAGSAYYRRRSNLFLDSSDTIPLREGIPMKRFCFAMLGTLVLTTIASAHCQVPCGIYGDQQRFEQMLEDEHTISKSQIEITNFGGGGSNPQDFNQATRWVMTKEQHASHIQEVIASYFMAQRIKADDPEYGKKLMAAHAVMVAAMKCKQSSDPATAKTLENSIFDFYRAYEGKEPEFDHSH